MICDDYNVYNSLEKFPCRLGKTFLSISGHRSWRASARTWSPSRRCRPSTWAAPSPRCRRHWPPGWRGTSWSRDTPRRWRHRHRRSSVSRRIWRSGRRRLSSCLSFHSEEWKMGHSRHYQLYVLSVVLSAVNMSVIISIIGQYQHYGPLMCH